MEAAQIVIAAIGILIAAAIAWQVFERRTQ